MEKTYNPALIQRTQRYMETHSISQNQFAAKVNLSSAALSSYLNQKYKGSVEAVERQLREFFKLDEEAEAAAEKTASLLPRAAYVPTSISEDVCQSIRFAQLEHCMVVLHGDAGVGKCPTTLYITIPAMVYLVQRIYSSLSSALRCRASALSVMPERCSPVRRCSAIPKRMPRAGLRL